MKVKTAYLGDCNSYSHAAATILSHGELVGYETLTKVIAAAESECDDAVLPIENIVEGAVNEVYDALFDSGLFISHQLILPIKHSLIVAEGGDMTTLERIISHPQAIAQCRNFLSTLSVPVEAVSSTSAALALASKTVAAIAFKPKAGQIALAHDIQDSAANATRFAYLTKAPSHSGDCASVVFDLNDEPGSLFKALEEFYTRNVNMTRILSRPHRTGSGKYRFFVDFECAGGMELNDLLDAIRSHCTAFRFLGRYFVERA